MPVLIEGQPQPCKGTVDKLQPVEMGGWKREDEAECHEGWLD
jgi:hypothetical protein